MRLRLTRIGTPSIEHFWFLRDIFIVLNTTDWLVEFKNNLYNFETMISYHFIAKDNKPWFTGIHLFDVTHYKDDEIEWSITLFNIDFTFWIYKDRDKCKSLAEYDAKQKEDALLKEQQRIAQLKAAEEFIPICNEMNNLVADINGPVNQTILQNKKKGESNEI